MILWNYICNKLIRLINIRSSAHSYLVLPVCSQVLNPWGRFITRPIHNLQVSNLEAWYCEVWNLKLHVYWLFSEFLPVRRNDGWQFELGIQQKLSILQWFITYVLRIVWLTILRRYFKVHKSHFLWLFWNWDFKHHQGLAQIHQHY